MEKQIGPVTTESWAEISGICADYFRNARISVNASSNFERDIQQMYILWLRSSRMSPDILGNSSKEPGTGPILGLDILLSAVQGIRDIFEKASQDAEPTADIRVYEITDNLEIDAQSLVIKMRKMANVRKPQFPADSSQVGGVPWTLATNQRLTSLIGDLSHVMNKNEQKLFGVLPAARKNMEKLCTTDVSQIKSGGPQGMESVRKLVMDYDLDPLLRQALAPQVSSNNVYENNLAESGGRMRNGNIGSTSKNNRYVGNTSRGAKSDLVNGDTIH